MDPHSLKIWNGVPFFRPYWNTNSDEIIILKTNEEENKNEKDLLWQIMAGVPGGVSVPGILIPFLSTHQQYPVLPSHCVALKAPFGSHCTIHRPEQWARHVNVSGLVGNGRCLVCSELMTFVATFLLCCGTLIVWVKKFLSLRYSSFVWHS